MPPTYGVLPLASGGLIIKEIFSEAFTSHRLSVNAKHLRELAGGGSQTTAQHTITAWRQDLSRKLAVRVRPGDQAWRAGLSWPKTR
jgi:hypothetical protein